MGGVLLLYLCLQYLVDVPGCPKGYLGPGGLALSDKQSHCTGGAHRSVCC